MAAIAVVSLGAGLGLSRLIISPAEAAANAAPPPAGPITVPVEQRLLANDVVMRGDAIYEDPVAVTVETGDIGGPAVVTGQVPEAGSNLDAGAVMLEITGRPVILLSGELPVYRTLRAGVSGPDVLQLKAALGALGIAGGDPASNVYDAATAAGVGELYARVGYPAPTAGEEADLAVDTARDMVRAAEEQVAAAQRDLNQAGAGTPQSERIRLQAAVDSAQFQYDTAKALCDAAPPDPACDPGDVIDKKGTLDVAIAQRSEGSAAVDTSTQRAALDAARRALTDAKDDLAKAQEGQLTPLPASEIVYLSALPRRVDAVDVRRGATVAGTPVMSVSGATLQIAGTVANTDAELVTEAAAVTITLPDGTEVTGTVQSVGGETESQEPGAPAPDPTRTRVVVVPDDLTEEQRWMLQGANVRVTIPVSSTEGEVMAVPIAALTAGPGGESRVEVMDDDGESVLVTVETGLAAGGFVEVTAVDGTLEVGDRVVIGVTETRGEDGTTPTDEPAPTDEPTSEESNA